MILRLDLREAPSYSFTFIRNSSLTNENSCNISLLLDVNILLDKTSKGFEISCIFTEFTLQDQADCVYIKSQLRNSHPASAYHSVSIRGSRCTALIHAFTEEQSRWPGSSAVGVGIFSHLTIRSDSDSGSDNLIPERFLIYLFPPY